MISAKLSDQRKSRNAGRFKSTNQRLAYSGSPPRFSCRSNLPECVEIVSCNNGFGEITPGNGTRHKVFCYTSQLKKVEKILRRNKSFACRWQPHKFAVVSRCSVQDISVFFPRVNERFTRLHPLENSK